MIKKNNVSRYLLYAIGEIILVVIGILIALQINNWNNYRMQREEEIQTLKNIRADFKNTIIEFEENNLFRERILTSTNTLLEIIHTAPISYDKPKLDSIISHLFVNPTYNGQSETLNILFNSGKINIIRSEAIKDALVKWPQEVEDITEDEIYSSDILFNSFQPLIKQYVSLYDIYRQISFKDYNLFDYEKPSTLESDYGGLFKDRMFEGVLVARQLPISISFLQSKDLIRNARDIVTLLDREIEKLHD